MIISIAKIGPPMENARQTPTTCRYIVVRAVVSALDQGRSQLQRRSQLRPPQQRRRHSLRRLWAVGSAAGEDVEDQTVKVDFAVGARAVVTLAVVSGALQGRSPLQRRSQLRPPQQR